MASRDRNSAFQFLHHIATNRKEKRELRIGKRKRENREMILGRVVIKELVSKYYKVNRET